MTDSTTENQAVETVKETASEENQTTRPIQETEDSEVNWKTQARKWETRAKQNKTRIDELEASIEKIKQGENEAIAKALKPVEEQLNAYRVQEEQRKWAADAAKTYKIPADLLRGETEEQITEHAKALAEFLKYKPKAPVVQDSGKTPTSEHSDLREAVRKLFGTA